MEESYHYHYHQQQIQQQQQQASGVSRLGLRSSGGEIVEVAGGHIVRSTGRKDRHSKVCTSKGPRDRRVRLSAHTAIQFYDVQDRLGFDRPSKAVDWLIKNAKAAIDKLAVLPAWNPTATTVTRFKNPKFDQNPKFEQNPNQLNHFEQHPDDSIVENPLGCSQNSSFLSPALDSAQNPANNSQSFPPLDLLSRTSSQSQDLRLSLQSFKDPLLHTHQTQESDNNDNNNSSDIYFDGAGCQRWTGNPPGGFQTMVSWGGDCAGFVFNSNPVSASAPVTPFLQPLFGQTTTNELFNNNSRREPLQSSITPSFRAWIDPVPPFTGVTVDQHPTLGFYRPCSGLGGFSGFGVPARVQGDEEEHDGVSDGPSAASSDSRH